MSVDTEEIVLTTEALPRVTKEKGARVPLKSWAVDVEDKAVEQATNLTKLPFAAHHVALMPDAHPGYGMPIGGVLFADKAVVPYAVGVDIGCGVSLMTTGLDAEYLEEGDRLQRILDEIAARVPVGNGPEGGHTTGTLTEFIYSAHGDPVSPQAALAIEQATLQVGTLGGGNHFIEVQAVEESTLAELPVGRVVVMVHSGSRSVGKKICDHWHKKALELCRRWHVELPDKELAFLPFDSEEGRQYMTDMREGLHWAWTNRRVMRRAIEGAILEVSPSAVVRDWVDVHHNYAAVEHHFGQNGIVHRKGAVRARLNEVVLIPGSMGTRSFVGEGLGEPQSFDSCQHGAGRARSRGATIRSQTEADFLASVSHVKLGGKAAQARDESPYAYKDVDRVMAASRDLVRPIVTLRPLGVVKG